VIDAVTAVVRRVSVGWLVGAIVASTATLMLLGYLAVAQWQRSARLLAQRRADGGVELLVTALTRDMRGVQTSVLPYLALEQQMTQSVLDVHSVGSAFARYPYPEAFFVSRNAEAGGPMTFYTRTDRPAPWLPHTDRSSRFPVLVASEPSISRTLLDRINAVRIDKRRFTTFHLTIQGADYQVIALLSYTDPVREHLATTVGFLVSLDWARRRYFPELTQQITRIQGPDSGLRLAIFDESGAAIVAPPGGGPDAPVSTRTFPTLFFDPDIAGLDPPADLPHKMWTARATVADDRALSAARSGATRTFVIATLSSLLLVAGFALTLYAARANVQLMTMRSEFVSAVTHELKTPIATIRAVGDSVASGRVTDVNRLKDYAQLVVQESKRLARLFDNLLAYSRITDVTEAYHFEPLDVGPLVDEALRGFSTQLSASGFEIDLDVPPDLPPVRADRTAIGLLLDNVIDNAIRYSTRTHWLGIRAAQSDGVVQLAISDAGMGIARDEIDHVVRRFFRGRRASSGGSGLGLAIANRIVHDHGGTMIIESAVGKGTTVKVSLPYAQPADHGSPA
jgi:signal transduction histidine kinase